MKAWQDLTSLVLDTVVNGDKIFQGVSKITLKKRYQLYLDLRKKWEKKMTKGTIQRLKRKNMMWVDQLQLLSVEA